MYHSWRKAVIDQLIEVGGLHFGEFLHKVWLLILEDCCICHKCDCFQSVIYSDSRCPRISYQISECLQLYEAGWSFRNPGAALVWDSSRLADIRADYFLPHEYRGKDPQTSSVKPVESVLFVCSSGCRIGFYWHQRSVSLALPRLFTHKQICSQLSSVVIQHWLNLIFTYVTVCVSISWKTAPSSCLPVETIWTWTLLWLSSETSWRASTKMWRKKSLCVFLLGTWLQPNMSCRDMPSL